MEIEATRTYLSMNSRSSFRPKYIGDETLALQKVSIPNPNLNHFFMLMLVHQLNGLVASPGLIKTV